MKIYGIFYISSDNCTYSAEIIKYALLDKTTAELLLDSLNQKTNTEYPKWEMQEIEVKDGLSFYDIAVISDELVKEQGYTPNERK